MKNWKLRSASSGGLSFSMGYKDEKTSGFAAAAFWRFGCAVCGGGRKGCPALFCRLYAAGHGSFAVIRSDRRENRIWRRGGSSGNRIVGGKYFLYDCRLHQHFSDRIVCGVFAADGKAGRVYSLHALSTGGYGGDFAV